MDPQRLAPQVARQTVGRVMLATTHQARVYHLAARLPGCLWNVYKQLDPLLWDWANYAPPDKRQPADRVPWWLTQ